MKTRSAALLLALALPACTMQDEAPASGASPAAKSADDRIVIGFSMDTLKEERWQRDRDLVVKRAQELGAEVKVQAANGSDVLQNSQAENLLTQGVDVLLVAPHNAESAATIVESAHRAGVPVIAYDRLIRNSDVDLYVTLDPTRVGELQAEWLTKHKPTGAYVLIGGAPTDNNARLVRDGQMKVLKPFLDSKAITIAADQWAKEWQPSEALKIMENALTSTGNKVDAVVASNDGTAGGAIQALAEQKLAGKVLVSGQDAELAACQRVVTGSQSMTVYKPIDRLAAAAVEAAIKLAKKEQVATTKTVNNGKKDVASLLLDPIAVDKDNMMSTVVKDGYHKLEDVYRDVPKEQWPQQN